VIEATGSVNGFSLARQAIRPGGTIVLKSTYRGDMTINFSSLVVDEIRLVGSRCGPLASALRLLEQQLIAPLPLIDSYFSLQEGLRAFKRANQAGVFKVLLICS
jgi:threonine dehydrogenase-like Zn-dependent dehydrogenase